MNSLSSMLPEPSLEDMDRKAMAMKNAMAASEIAGYFMLFLWLMVILMVINSEISAYK